MRGALLVLACVLLAGCARGPPPPVEPGDPTFSDGPPLPTLDPPRFVWRTLAEGALLVTYAQDTEIAASVPSDAVAVYVNLTLQQGAAQGLHVVMDACRWSRETAFVGGQTFAVDCGGLPPGDARAIVRTAGGLLRGTVQVTALACEPAAGHRPCPAPLPPRTEG